MVPNETFSRETVDNVSSETFSRETASLDPWFVTGFLQGEGCFTFSRSGKQLALYFSVKARAPDAALLDALRAYFGGIGKLYPLPLRANGSAGLLFRVSRHDELERIVDHFDAWPLRPSKSAAFGIWRTMVLLKRNFRDPPRAELHALAEQLSTQTRSGRRTS